MKRQRSSVNRWRSSRPRRNLSLASNRLMNKSSNALCGLLAMIMKPLKRLRISVKVWGLHCYLKHLVLKRLRTSTLNSRTVLRRRILLGNLSSDANSRGRSAMISSGSTTNLTSMCRRCTGRARKVYMVLTTSFTWWNRCRNACKPYSRGRYKRRRG